MSDTFCIMPWKNLSIKADGGVTVCCASASRIRIGNRDASINDDSLEEIWNSNSIVSMRQDMTANRWNSACYVCRLQEEKNLPSLRKQFNKLFLNDTEQNPGDFSKSRDEQQNDLIATARLTHGHLKDSVSSLQFEVGNLCNLKCRMCNPGFSSQIERDVVHRKWDYTYTHNNTDEGNANKKSSTNQKHWHEQPDFIVSNMIEKMANDKIVSVIGGEPLFSESLKTALKILVERGTSNDIHLHISTNGTTLSAEWLSILREFKLLSLAISIDGLGNKFNYIRYPAQFSRLERTIPEFISLGNARIMAAPTIQAYNTLDLVELYQSFTASGFNINNFMNILEVPHFLSPKILPPGARKIASDRLFEYADSDCPRESAPSMIELANSLVNMGDEYDFDLLQEFMEFTNDLDVSRGQNFAHTFPELFHYIEDTGFTWTSKTRFANALS